MRLNQFLAACGLGSRRNAEILILSGRVRVNGAVVENLATFVEPGKDKVAVDGKPVAPPRGHTYYLLNKPEGVVTTARDPEGRSTVVELVPARPRVFPVGRLDQGTSGALLLTDDGSLAHRILHPRYGVEKEYVATVEGIVGDETLDAFRDGVLLPGERRPTAPARVEVLERKARRTRLRVIIHEGRNRQVRRMLETLGHPVLRLVRERVGPVVLGTLTPGTFRALTPEEVEALRRETRGPRRGTSRPRAPRAKPARSSSSRPTASRPSSSKPTAARASSSGPKPPRPSSARPKFPKAGPSRASSSSPRSPRAGSSRSSSPRPNAPHPRSPRGATRNAGRARKRG